MKRLIGLLMMLGLVVGVVGCGDDDNPVKSSNEDLLVGTWLDEDGDSITFRSDATFVDGDGDDGTLVDSDGGFELVGTWSLAGDKLTVTYSEADYRELFIGLLAAEIGSLAEVSDAEMGELFDAFMADEFPDGLVLIITINSITDTELITTDEDDEREVATRKT